jgi:hypothetical protein
MELQIRNKQGTLIGKINKNVHFYLLAFSCSKHLTKTTKTYTDKTTSECFVVKDNDVKFKIGDIELWLDVGDYFKIV